MQHEINSSYWLQRVNDLISALKPLKKKRNCMLNVANFSTFYNLKEDDVKSLVDLVLQFQHLFLEEFAGYSIEKNWKNGQIYLNLIALREQDQEDPPLKEIILSKVDSARILDIVHYYQHVKIGKGFDPNLKTSVLCQKVKKVYLNHPYLFLRGGNGYLYPSGLALELGTKLKIYKKLNRKLSNFKIDGFSIRIEEADNG